MLAQSSIAVTVVMIAFQRAGLFGQAEAIMFVYGANVGSSVLTYMLSVGLTGAARQVALYLIWLNILGAIILVPLLYVELWFGVPLVGAASSAISADPGTQAALVYMIFNVVPVIPLLLTLGLTDRILRRAIPETVIERHTKPMYLSGALPREAGLAFHLVELEQARLINPLITALDSLRSDRPGKALDNALDGFDSLAGTVATAVDSVTSSTDLGTEAFEQLDTILKIQGHLAATRQTLAGLAAEASHLRRAAPELNFPDAAVEGLDTILHVLADVAVHREPEDIDVLVRISSDEGNGIKSVRAAYLAGEDAVAPGDRVHLLAASNYCERLIWLAGACARGYGNLPAV